MRSEHQAAPVTEFNAIADLALYIAFELSRKKWKLAFSDGRSNRIRTVTIAAQDWPALRREIEVARKRFGLTETAAVRSCYEIGREGFWLHRALLQRASRTWLWTRRRSKSTGERSGPRRTGWTRRN